MTRRIERTTLLAACCAALALAACGGAAVQQRSEGAMTDAEIAAVLDVANMGEIQQAQLASRNASDEQVRSYATAMLTGHRDALEQQEALLRPRGITPTESTLSQQLRQRGRALEQQLQGLSGEEFDRAYMQAQLQQHQDLLRLLEQQLIPSAQDPAYRVYLERLRDDIAAHLQNAQRIQQEVVG